MVADDVLGTIEFKAPKEASGTDAILTGAPIAAIAEATFTSSEARTSIFHCTSAAASERMRIDKDGKVGIGTTTPGKDLAVNAASSPTIRIREGWWVLRPCRV